MEARTQREVGGREKEK